MTAEFVRTLFPKPVWKRLVRIRARARLQGNAARSPREIFSDIYRTGAWAGRHSRDRAGSFYSGPGSDERFGKPYSSAVLSFIRERGIKRVVDLGCGDFRVGRLIAPQVEHYVGVDVVPELIAHNAKHCAMPNVEFHCLDVTSDRLPPGDLCLVREVFQHLSNAQILSALGAMRQYRYGIVTEAQPADLAGFRPNRDRPAGTSARSFFGSGIRLDLPPFNIGGVEVLFEIPWPEEKDIVLRSFLFAPQSA